MKVLLRKVAKIPSCPVTIRACTDISMPRKKKMVLISRREKDRCTRRFCRVSSWESAYLRSVIIQSNTNPSNTPMKGGSCIRVCNMGTMAREPRPIQRTTLRVVGFIPDCNRSFVSSGVTTASFGIMNMVRVMGTNSMASEGNINVDIW